MGKRIIQQARGKGSLTYRVRKKAFNKKIKLPLKEGEGEIIKILHSPAHSAPLMEVKFPSETCYLPAFNNAFVGQKIKTDEPKQGNILSLGKIPVSMQIYNIERNPGDGGKFMRSAGSSAAILKHLEDGRIIVAFPNKKEVALHPNCRAVIGVIAGEGRILKPFVKAGKKFYKMRAKGKLYPRTSAVKMNAVDHPFGSGRGKRIKSKIAKRNAPPGRKVGHLRPRRTGHKK